jgi:hypothetical protein
MEKVRKHPNFFDILLILVILAAAAAAYLLSHQGADTSTLRTRTYRVELQGLRDTMADAVQIGDPVTDTVKNLDLGTVTDVEVQPYTVAVTDEDAGVVRQVAMEDYVTLWVTLEVDTTETDSQISTTSGYVLRTGTSISVSIGDLVASGYILDIVR